MTSTEHLEDLAEEVRDIDFDLLINAIKASASQMQIPATEVAEGLSLGEIDLDYLSEALQLFGITDPIGQLSSWIYDRLKELASWFASTVQVIISPIKSAIDVAASVVSSVYRAVYDAFSYMQSAFALVQRSLTESVSRLWDLLTTVASAVRELPGLLWSTIQRLGESISRSIDAISTAIVNAITYVQGAILSGISTLGTALTSLIDRIWAGLTTIGSAIASGFASLGSKIAEFYTALGNAIASIGERIWSFLTYIGKAVADGFASLGSRIAEFFSALGSALASLGERIWSFLTQIASALAQGFASLGAKVAEFFTALGSALAGIGERIWSGLMSIWSNIQSALASAAQAILGFLTTIGGAIASLGERLWSGLMTVWSLIQGAITSAVSSIQSFLTAIGSAIASIGERIWSGLTAIGSTVVSALATARDAITGYLTSVASTIISVLAGLGERLWAGITFIGEKTVAGLEYLGRLVIDYYKALGSAIAGIGERLWTGMLTVGDILASKILALTEQLSSFAKYVQAFGAQVLGGIASIGNFIKGFFDWLAGLPELLARLFEPVIKFFIALGNIYREFITNPLKFISERILTPLWKALVFIGEIIWSGLTWLGQAIAKGLATIASVIVDGIRALWTGLSKVFASVVDFIFSLGRKIGEAIQSALSRIIEYFMGLIADMGNRVSEAVSTLVEPVITAMYKDMGIGTAPYLTPVNFAKALAISTGLSIPFLIYPLFVSVPVRAFSFGIRGIAMGMKEMKLEKHISFKPIGLGFELRLDFVKAIGATLYTFGEELVKFVDKFYEPVWFGIGFWFARYMSSVIAYFIRNYIPVEFPTVREVEESWLRARVAEAIPPKLGRKKEDIQEAMLYYLKLKGYSDFLLDYQFAHPEELYTTLVDRFRIPRKVPLGGVWKLPSIADVARMWVRDILRPPDITAEEMVKNLTKIYEAVGLYRDIGLIYTLLAFRYPAVTELAEFYWRGMSKTLWLEDSLEEPEWKQMFSITWSASSPYALNESPKRADILNRMISTYLKWHDLFPAPWAPEFPTDKAVVAELIADLPTRIDLRWMARWGIFQHLADAGVDVMADLKTIYTKFVALTGEEVRSLRATPEIRLDARLLSRFLIATGLNPLLAPIVSVAQIHAALASELTLLRTGFIESMRRGFITLDVSENLMSGLIKIRFVTGYIDPKTGEFREVVYPKPVFWLPAERRLLQLRAILDRYNLLMRDLLSRVTYAVINIALFPEEGIETIASFHSTVSEHIKGLVKAVSGVEWKPELDSEYMRVWISYASQLIPIGARTWIRRYISRYLGWIFYRLLYGWISYEDFDKIIKAVSAVRVRDKEIRLLSDIEIEFFSQLSKELVAIIRKENIPSPSTLATFAEYMVVSESVVVDVLKKHRVPDEYWDLWRRYISVKPMKPEFRSLVTTAIKAYRRRVISREDFEKTLKDALEFGFTGKEIDLIKRRAELEEAIDEAREASRAWIPSPSTLVSLAEYIELPVDLIKSTLEVRGVAKEWIDIWTQYVLVRPVKSDYRAVVSVAIRALRVGAITEDKWKQILEKAKEYGFTSREIELIQQRAELELAVETAKEWSPTVLTIINMLEVVPEAIELLKLYPIKKEFRDIIVKYAERKPLADEVRALVNALYRAKRYTAIPRELEEKAMSIAKQLGITDQELAVRDLALELTVLADEARTWLPAPATIATLSEYLTVPRELVEAALKARRIPEEWAKIWMQYIEVKPVKSDYKAVLATAIRALRYGAIAKERFDELLKLAGQYGFTPKEIELIQLRAELELLIDEFRAWMPSILTVITIAEYVPEVVKLLELYNVDPRVKPYIERYAYVKPLVDESRVLINAFYRAKRYVQIPKELEDRVISTIKQLGVTDAELTLRDLALELQVLADESRQWLPSPSTLAVLAEYVEIPADLVMRTLEARRVPGEWTKIWLQYIAVRPLKADYKSLIATAVRALKANAISEESFKKILEDARNYGFTPREIEILQRRVELELAIEASKEWSPTVLTLIGILETVPEALELLKLYPVKKEFREVIVKYAERKPVADEIKLLVATYYKAKRYATRYGQVIPKEIESKVEEYMKIYGITDAEKAIRDLATELEIMVDLWKVGETIPTLGILATMSEYIEIPSDYILKILSARRVEATYAQLWMQYISARQIATEINRVVSAFQALYTRFSVPEDLVKTVKGLMVRGGWTAKELEIFDLELYLRRQYRILVALTPSVRGFIADGVYLPNYEKLLEDLFTAYGIDLKVFKQQLDYYKALLKNRRLWRHFSWYRTQLTYAYQYGAISDDEARRRLEKFKGIGLVDDQEIDMIIEGMKLRKAGYSAYRATYYRS